MPKPKKGADGYYRRYFRVDGIEYSVRSKDFRVLAEKEQKKRAQLAEQARPSADKMTVQLWGDAWREVYTTNLRKASQERIRSLQQNYLYPLYGPVKIGAVKRIHLQNLLNDMAKKRAKDTVKHMLQMLTAMFTAAVEDDMINKNPAAGLSMPICRPPATHRAISERERIILLETAKTHPMGVLVQFLLYTGLRPGEVPPLTGADLDNGYIRVNKALEARTNEIKETKSKAGSRRVPVIPRLAAVLPDVQPNQYIFPQPRGGLMTKTVMRRMWHSFVLAMQETETVLVEQKRLPILKEQLPPMQLYDLRHTYCTDLERAGVPINVAAKLMGHSSVKVTERIYTHTGEDMLRRASSQLSAFLSDGHSDGNDMVNRGKKAAES
ncbi:tyrosine-type recombinase/integrase [Agathobaculum sp. NSJ-28]|uniref:Tyrosine-type recombinase/integrase n=1 Tax=Agathobaculum faecis TaxID=2763013 RepID=A0A923S006_9FIRM|nr:site-specific integrase [Agathobaculum faecis]MBC5726795.1 tyrosine-type recombinase/integrase [Agathobaculum faecis]